MTRPFRAKRGGSFNNDAQNLRSAYRNRNDAENRNQNIGFRVAVVPANTLARATVQERSSPLVGATVGPARSRRHWRRASGRAEFLSSELGMRP